MRKEKGFTTAGVLVPLGPVGMLARSTMSRALLFVFLVLVGIAVGWLLRGHFLKKPELHKPEPHKPESKETGTGN